MKSDFARWETLCPKPLTLHRKPETPHPKPYPQTLNPKTQSRGITFRAAGTRGRIPASGFGIQHGEIQLSWCPGFAWEKRDGGRGVKEPRTPPPPPLSCLKSTYPHFARAKSQDYHVSRGWHSRWHSCLRVWDSGLRVQGLGFRA